MRFTPFDIYLNFHGVYGFCFLEIETEDWNRSLFAIAINDKSEFHYLCLFEISIFYRIFRFEKNN